LDEDDFFFWLVGWFWGRGFYLAVECSTCLVLGRRVMHARVGEEPTYRPSFKWVCRFGESARGDSGEAPLVEKWEFSGHLNVELTIIDDSVLLGNENAVSHVLSFL
jgi:hypothetical protein